MRFCILLELTLAQPGPAVGVVLAKMQGHAAGVPSL